MNILVRVGAAVVVALACAACHGATAPTAPAAVAVATTTTVQRGDVVAVTTLDGVVIATPAIVATAPHAGVVRRAAGLRPGQQVSAGTALFTVDGTSVASPAAATFVGWSTPDAVTVPARLPVARLTYAGFAVTAATPPDLAYRIFSHQLSARAELRGGPAGFACRLLDPDAVPALPDPNANSGDAGSSGAGPTVTCAIPRNVYAVQGLRAFLALSSGLARNALTLPVTAVAGAAQTGQVWLIGRNGKATLRTVGLGMTNGAVVQVTSGLAVGDTVSSVAPDQSHYR